MRRSLFPYAVVIILAVSVAWALAGDSDMPQKNVTDSGHMDPSSMPKMNNMQMMEQIDEHSAKMSERFGRLQSRMQSMMKTDDCQMLKDSLADLYNSMQAMHGQMMQHHQMTQTMMSMMQGEEAGEHGMMMHGGDKQ